MPEISLAKMHGTEQNRKKHWDEAKYCRLSSTEGARYRAIGGPAMLKNAFPIPEKEPMRNPIVLLGRTLILSESASS